MAAASIDRFSSSRCSSPRVGVLPRSPRRREARTRARAPATWAPWARWPPSRRRVSRRIRRRRRRHAHRPRRRPSNVPPLESVRRDGHPRTLQREPGDGHVLQSLAHQRVRRPLQPHVVAEGERLDGGAPSLAAVRPEQLGDDERGVEPREAKPRLGYRPFTHLLRQMPSTEPYPSAVGTAPPPRRVL